MSNLIYSCREIPRHFRGQPDISYPFFSLLVTFRTFCVRARTATNLRPAIYISLYFFYLAVFLPQIQMNSIHSSYYPLFHKHFYCWSKQHQTSSVYQYMLLNRPDHIFHFEYAIVCNYNTGRANILSYAASKNKRNMRIAFPFKLYAAVYGFGYVTTIRHAINNTFEIDSSSCLVTKFKKLFEGLINTSTRTKNDFLLISA